MSKILVLYNPTSNNGLSEEETKKIGKLDFEDEVEYVNVLGIDDVKTCIADLQADDKLIISGGDGTLNHFINDLDGYVPTNDVYYYATGTGNDFLTSIGSEKGVPVKINDLLGGLPIVTVNGKDYRFINGVGFGIDGYCCEKGDELREATNEPVNYTSIAIKGLLFHFKPVNATVTVDGKTKSYKKVWLAPTMYGRFYGGGMIPTPDQKRGEGKVSTLVYHNCGKLKALMVFPSIFKGEHVKHTKMIDVLSGKNVTVTFDRPTALQIDGETIKNVTTYTVKI